MFRDRFVSTDLAETEQFFRSAYTTDTAFRLPASPDRFAFAQDTVGAGGFAVSRAWTSLGYEGLVKGMGDLFTVVFVRAGGVSWERSRFGDVRLGPGDTGLAPPVDEFDSCNQQADLDVLTLGVTEVAAYAAHACGIAADDVEITGLSPISHALARYWNATIAHVRDDVQSNPVAAASPILIDNAFWLLGAALLSTFPNTALAAATDPEAAAVRGDVSEARLREVLDYLDTHADRPVGPADVATVAGMPVREVIRGLRRRHATSPAQRLWQARLRGVHRDLTDADPAAGATVAAVAARWGFANLGRFRTAYANAFDEQPEDTLRR